MPDFEQLPLFDPSTQQGNPANQIVNPRQFSHPLTSYQVPAFTQQDVNLTVVLQRNFEALSTLSDQIARNLGGNAALLDRQAGTIDRMVNGHQRLHALTRQDVDQNRQILEFAEKQAQARNRILDAEEKYGASQKENVGALRSQLQLAGMLNREGRIRYMDAEGRPAEPISIDEYMRRDTEERQPIREQIAQQVALAQPERASIRQALQQLSRGNIGGALGELTQATPGLGRPAAAMERIGASLESRGFAAGAQGGAFNIARGLGLRGIGGLAGLAGEFAFSPAALGIAGLKGLQFYQGQRAAGMQTGEQGFGAFTEGVGAQFKAVTEGLNPFDALSIGAARAVARGIQSEGFSGSIRAAWQDSVTDVIKHTGMDSQQALSLMSNAVNNFGESADEFNKNMLMMRDTSEKTSLSVGKAAEALQSIQDAFFPQAGTRGAEAAVAPGQALITATKGAFRRPTLKPAIQQNWQRLVTLAGLNPADAFTTKTILQMNMILDKNVSRLWDLKNSNPQWKRMSVEEWVQRMEGQRPGIFEIYIGPGASAQDVIDLMHAVTAKGGGLEKTQTELAPGVRKVKARSEWYRKNANFGGYVGGEKAAYISRLQDRAKGDDLTPAQVRRIVAPIYDAHGHIPEAYEKSKDILEQIERNKQTSRSLTPAGSTRSARRTTSQMLESYQPKVLVDLTHDAKKLLKVSEATEPGSRQKYFDSRRGTTGTQGMNRP